MTRVSECHTRLELYLATYPDEFTVLIEDWSALAARQTELIEHQQTRRVLIGRLI